MANIKTLWREFKKWVKRYVRKMCQWLLIIRWIMLTSFFGGLALTCWADKIGEWWPWSNVMSHFGEALVIASIIGFFLDISEVKDFMEKRIANILFGKEYIESVNRDRLITLSGIAMNGIGAIEVNNDAYDFNDFVTRIIDNVVLENIGQIYRKDFNETIHYSILKPDEIENRTISDGYDNTRDVVHVTTTTRFQLIAPREDEDQTFDLSNCCSYEIELIPWFKDQFTFDLTVDGKKVNIESDKWIKTKSVHGSTPQRNILFFECKYDVRFKSEHGFTTSIEYTRDTYQYALPGRLKSNMNTLTKGATILFSSRNELELDAEFFGLSGYNKPSITPNSISMQYNDWALPEDGYFISWQAKKP